MRLAQLNMSSVYRSIPLGISCGPENDGKMHMTAGRAVGAHHQSSDGTASAGRSSVVKVRLCSRTPNLNFGPVQAFPKFPVPESESAVRGSNAFDPGVFFIGLSHVRTLEAGAVPAYGIRKSWMLDK